MEDKDIIINTQTGLPALPEGQHWRVSVEDSWLALYPRHVNVSVIKVFIVIKQDYFDLGLFRIKRRRTITEQTEQIVATHSVWGDEVKAGAAKDQTVLNAEGNRCVYLPPNDLAAEHIRRTAEYVLQKKEKIERMEALLGDYPPNSIPVIDNA